MRKASRWMSQDAKDRLEEQLQERYANLFEIVHARQIRQFYENGGRGDFKPAHADVHDEVSRIQQREQEKRRQDAAEDRADVARIFRELP